MSPPATRGIDAAHDTRPFSGHGHLDVVTIVRR
jgi:hypothetical protein